jgi:acetamidase/formamidase
MEMLKRDKKITELEKLVDVSLAKMNKKISDIVNKVNEMIHIIVSE